jgi:hypothetical protein
VKKKVKCTVNIKEKNIASLTVIIHSRLLFIGKNAGKLVIKRSAKYTISVQAYDLEHSQK